MISPEQRAEIRRLYYAEHWRVGTIATTLGVHYPCLGSPVRTVGVTFLLLTQMSITVCSASQRMNGVTKHEVAVAPWPPAPSSASTMPTPRPEH